MSLSITFFNAYCNQFLAVFIPSPNQRHNYDNRNHCNKQTKYDVAPNLLYINRKDFGKNKYHNSIYRLLECKNHQGISAQELQYQIFTKSL